MSILDQMIPRAKAAQKKVVLPEGQDPRVIQAAVEAKQLGVCEPLVLGTPAEIAAAETAAGVTLASAGIAVEDYTASARVQELAAAFYEKRKAKGITEEEAVKTMTGKRIYYGNMLVAQGYADGLVAGSIASTADMLRGAFQCVGTDKAVKKASSAFIMDLGAPTASGDGTLLFADCAVNICPTAEELVDIAVSSAKTFEQLVAKQPKVAFLSFSTKGSAKHELVDKVTTAAALAKARFAELGLDYPVDGEVQADAALVPSVASAKNKGGAIQGDANVLIFPDIQAGNICYKLVQRLGNNQAYGPLLQGVAKPVNDLSRGCSAKDIVGQICITVLQCK
ncbi:MAG: phosphate acetyltransferase [Kiritimatiellae bacterium]|nr:phosphate acetyltransferase [Kiritimatiellia bacterium]